VDDRGQVLLEEYQRLLNDRTKLVAVSQVSNALGTVTPVKEIVDLAHRAGARVLVDGAQSVSHMRVNVQAIDADFFVFSGHKVFAPTGIGVVYGKRDILEDMPPWQGGGNMIADVTFERTLYQGVPARFEAGTGNIADAVGLGAAIDYVERIGIENIARYEHDLLAYATQRVKPIPGIRLIGTADDKASVLSFVLAGYRPEEVGKRSTRKASRCAPATTARSRSCAASVSKPRCGPRWPSTIPARKWICWCRYCSAWRGERAGQSASRRARPTATRSRVSTFTRARNGPRWLFPRIRRSNRSRT
jgi:selenocysteine lyase/cysteine desulfurase